MILDSIGITIYVAVVAAVLGLVMGSFLNCCAIRMINGEPIAKGRSHCGSCGHTLGPLDLIPVLSWICLKGKCRYCGEDISARYPLTELISALVFVSLVLRFGLTLETVEMLILAGLLLCISFTDIEGYIIPDRLIIAGICVRAVFIIILGIQDGTGIGSLALQSVIGGLCISVPLLLVVFLMEKVMGKEAMGGGDIKLLFMAGLYFPWSVNVLAFIIACVIGIITGIIALSTRSSEEKHIPFGPSISAGFWIAALCGAEILRWYTGLF